MRPVSGLALMLGHFPAELAGVLVVVTGKGRCCHSILVIKWIEVTVTLEG
jgi:hypothetical protein